jgi:hypothetical protein
MRLNCCGFVQQAKLKRYLSFIRASTWSKSALCAFHVNDVDVGEVSPIDQAVIDLVSGAANWGVPNFEMDSCMPLVCLQQSRSIGGGKQNIISKIHNNQNLLVTIQLSSSNPIHQCDSCLSCQTNKIYYTQ